jgi:hypothetical protein
MYDRLFHASIKLLEPDSQNIGEEGDPVPALFFLPLREEPYSLIIHHKLTQLILPHLLIRNSLARSRHSGKP